MASPAEAGALPVSHRVRPRPCREIKRRAGAQLGAGRLACQKRRSRHGAGEARGRRRSMPAASRPRTSRARSRRRPAAARARARGPRPLRASFASPSVVLRARESARTWRLHGLRPEERRRGTPRRSAGASRRCARMACRRRRGWRRRLDCGGEPPGALAQPARGEVLQGRAAPARRKRGGRREPARKPDHREPVAAREEGVARGRARAPRAAARARARERARDAARRRTPRRAAAASRWRTRPSRGSGPTRPARPAQVLGEGTASSRARAPRGRCAAPSACAAAPTRAWCTNSGVELSSTPSSLACTWSRRRRRSARAASPRTSGASSMAPCAACTGRGRGRRGEPKPRAPW